MLVKVRTRGRPAPVDIRDVIVVDNDSQMKNKLLQESFDHAEELGNTPTDDSGCSPSDSGCSMGNAQPVLFVRARQTKKAMLVDGKLSIIMDNANADPESLDKTAPDGTMSEGEFLRSHGGDGPACSQVKRESPMQTAPGAKRKCCDPNHVPGTLGTPQSVPGTVPALNADPDLLSDVLSDTLSNSLDAGLDAGLAAAITSPSVDSPNTTASGNSGGPVPDIFDTVDIFTHKGIYLSADCSCPDDNCQCLNCLIHRNEEELSQYIQGTGVPLTSLRGSLGDDSEFDNNNHNGKEHPVACSNAACECTLTDCACADCYVHPTEIIPFERFYYHGVLNTKLRRKTIVRFNNKLVPSEYWWEFLTVRVPEMQDAQLEALDLKDWFERLVKSHAGELLDAHTEEFPFNDLEGFYVI